MRRTRSILSSEAGPPRCQDRRAAWALAGCVAVSASCTATDVVEPRLEAASSRVEIAASHTHPGRPARTVVEHVKVRFLTDGREIRGSAAVLQRRGDGLTVRVRTRELEPGETVDVFWAVFNDPGACENPNPLTGAPCSPADLFIPATEGSLHYVATLAADLRGRLDYWASLATGSSAGCVGAPFPCHTVTRPLEAEVHSPMFVPNGGAGRQAAQFF